MSNGHQRSTGNSCIHPTSVFALERQFIGIHIGRDNDLMKCLLIAVHPQGLMVEAPSVEGAPEMARLLDPDATAEALLAISLGSEDNKVSSDAKSSGVTVYVIVQSSTTGPIILVV